MWIKNNHPIKWTNHQKSDLADRTTHFLQTTQKLANNIHQVKLRGGRIYLTALFKVSHSEENTEYNFARITVYDSKGASCSADWQASDCRTWIVLYEGTLEECLSYVENDSQDHFSL